MNCDDYLAMLSTLPVEDVMQGVSARAHAAECRDCNRVLRVVAERERNLLMAYEGMEPEVPASLTATNAMSAARHRRVNFLYRLALAIAIVSTLVYLAVSRIEPAAPPVAVTEEHWNLQCLSGEQAAELLRPIMGRTGSIVIHPASPLAIISVRAPAEMMAKTKALLDRYDSPAQSRCAARVVVPKRP